MLKSAKCKPVKLVANQPFTQPTMSTDRKDGSYSGSSGCKSVPVSKSIFVPNTNRSSGPLK